MKVVKIIRLGKLRKNLFEAITESNKESAKVWNFCKDKLQEAILNKTEWPNIYSLHLDTKGKFNLHSQSVQQVCRAFVSCLETTKKLKRINPKSRFPHKNKDFYPTIWTSQAAKIMDGVLVLPMGRERNPLKFKVYLPNGGYPCKIIWKNGYELHICQDTPEEQKVEQSSVVATIDLGEIHQIACVTSEGKALLVNGRGIRSVKHQNSKMLGKTQGLKMRCKKGSRRWKKIVKSRNKQSERNRRRFKDLRHKGTRQAVEFLFKNKVNKLFVGNPDGVRKRISGNQHNQRMSLWEYGKDIQYLKEKTGRLGIEMLTGSERGTSSTCPSCGYRRRQKGRRWVCTKCGFRGHRDLVGATNMHQLAFDASVECPQRAMYLRPGLTRLGSSRRADTLQSNLEMGKVDDPTVAKQRSARNRKSTFSFN